MAAMKERYGINGKIVAALCERYRRMLRVGPVGWQCDDEFLLWAMETGYKTGAQLRKHDKYLPHGPDNSYWYVIGQDPVKHRETVVISRFCEDCKEECPASGEGCKAWREKYIKTGTKISMFRPKYRRNPNGRCSSMNTRIW